VGYWPFDEKHGGPPAGIRAWAQRAPEVGSIKLVFDWPARGFSDEDGSVAEEGESILAEGLVFALFLFFDLLECVGDSRAALEPDFVGGFECVVRAGSS